MNYENACTYKNIFAPLFRDRIHTLDFVSIYVYNSMALLLMHIVAHSTRLKTNNQPIKKFLSLAVVKVVKNHKILTFKVNFLCQKLSKSFLKKFS